MDIKRREFFERAGLTSAALASLPVLAGADSKSMPAGQGGHQHDHVSGPLASATVSFGAWPVGISRFPNVGGGPGGVENVHALTPFEATVKAGGTVNFIIAGFHQVLVYGDGVQPDDINVGLTVSVSNPPGPPLINDPSGRIYRGVDPSFYPQDRTEVVQFHEKGTYLVICGVLPHFAIDRMFGFVRVLP